MKALFVLIIFIVGCTLTSVTGTVSETNKDVLLLSILVQDHLRETDGRDINLQELLRRDTLNRISNSFEKVELKFKGGHISVYYKFLQSRDSKEIELSDKERELTNDIRWTERDLKNQYDGEILFDYGERFYRVRKIVVNRSTD